MQTSCPCCEKKINRCDSKYLHFADLLPFIFMLHFSGGEHTKEVYLAVKECAIVCCTHAWNSADSQSTETSDNSKPHELVLSVGTSIVKEVALQLEDTQLQKAEAFYPR